MTNMEGQNMNVPAIPYPNMSAQPQVQQSAQQGSQQDAVANKISLILTQILQTVNEIGIELAVIDDEKCKNCSLVHKCRRLVKQFKELIELSRR